VPCQRGQLRQPGVSSRRPAGRFPLRRQEAARARWAVRSLRSSTCSCTSRVDGGRNTTTSYTKIRTNSDISWDLEVSARTTHRDDMPSAHITSRCCVYLPRQREAWLSGLVVYLPHRTSSPAMSAPSSTLSPRASDDVLRKSTKGQAFAAPSPSATSHPGSGRRDVRGSCGENSASLSTGDTFTLSPVL
jgi:hypothetical protein